MNEEVDAIKKLKEDKQLAMKRRKEKGEKKEEKEPAAKNGVHHVRKNVPERGVMRKRKRTRSRK